MGTVVRQETNEYGSTLLSFENYQDFLDYQKKEREQDVLDVSAKDNIQALLDFYDAPKSYYRLELSEEEYYYLSCILGHLVPAGEISKSLLDKVGLDDLDCEDFDKVVLTCTEIKLVENK